MRFELEIMHLKHSLSDLYLAAAVMAVVSIASGAGVAAMARHLGGQAKLLLLLGLVSLLVWMGFHLRDSLVWAKILPVTGVPVAGNWSMPMAAMVVGAAWNNFPAGRLRRLMLLMPLMAVAAFVTMRPIFAAVPQTHNVVVGLLTKQSTQATCTPAAGATLLKYHGIHTTEGEMADLARTTEQGTSPLGLYRALSIKTRGTPFGVGVMTDGTREMLGTCGMAVLSVGYDDANAPQAKELVRNGFMPGVHHSVVFFKFLPDGRALIGDPETGLEQWPAQTLWFLWKGDAVYLTDKQSWGS